MSDDETWSAPDDEEWTPPTEAQMKVLAAKRERSDKISKLMGDYMLKGYRMLATTCAHCMCVQLQDRHGVNYCVACQEVDCHETSKDNPALSSRAASGVRAEEAFITQRSLSPAQPPTNSTVAAPPATTGPSPNLDEARLPSGSPDIVPRVGALPRVRLEQPVRQLETVVTDTWDSRSGADTQGCEPLLSVSLTVVTDKLVWATSLLRQECDVARVTELAVCIRELYNTGRCLGM